MASVILIAARFIRTKEFSCDARREIRACSHYAQGLNDKRKAQEGGEDDVEFLET